MQAAAHSSVFISGSYCGKSRVWTLRAISASQSRAALGLFPPLDFATLGVQHFHHLRVLNEAELITVKVLEVSLKAPWGPAVAIAESERRGGTILHTSRLCRR
jgi:hypothetical protein